MTASLAYPDVVTVIGVGDVPYTLPCAMVYLGTDGSFCHWGDRSTGAVYYVTANPRPECYGGLFGPRWYWVGHVIRCNGRPGYEFTQEGLGWGQPA